MRTTTLGSAHVAVRNRAILGEGPIWDQRTERLIWVDIIGGGEKVSGPDTLLPPTPFYLRWSGFSVRPQGSL
jgi:hypothetical protein